MTTPAVTPTPPVRLRDRIRRGARFTLLALAVAMLLVFLENPRGWIADFRAGWNSVCPAP